MVVTVVGHSPGLAAPRPGGGAPAPGEQHGPLLVVHLRVQVLRVFTHRLQPGGVVEPVKLCADLSFQTRRKREGLAVAAERTS